MSTPTSVRRRQNNEKKIIEVQSEKDAILVEDQKLIRPKEIIPSLVVGGAVGYTTGSYIAGVTSCLATFFGATCIGSAVRKQKWENDTKAEGNLLSEISGQPKQHSMIRSKR